MEQLIDLAIFAGQFLIVFIFILGVGLLLTSLVLRQKLRPELEVQDLNEKLDIISDSIQSTLMDKKAYKQFLKQKKTKDEKAEKENKPHLFVIQFKGDVQAKAADELRDEVTAVLTVAKPNDQVLVSIESPGGVVHGYGLCASQLLRLKTAGLKVTASVDKVAASGGYLMACVASEIVAAPFAIVGSIGVVAQIPNFNRFLRKHDVDYEEITAGEYKRTVSVMGEITPKGREKFQEQIQETHELFKSFVKENRPTLDISKVATGEYWFGRRAIELGLVDQLQTSDEFITSRKDTHRIFKVKFLVKKTLSEKIQESFSAAIEKSFDSLAHKFFY
jgi:serine protease SohB